MSIESYVHAMPKVELYLQLEGAVNKDTLLLIADQNDVASSIKRFSDWIKLLDEVDFHRLSEIIQVTGQWIQEPEDLTRIVYDAGVNLAKQNVRYAEICINPTLYMQSGLTFESVMEALIDGQDRVLRGWGVRIAWILSMPRDEPRRGDEIARWATSVAARKAGIVGLGLTGPENAQPAGQFERAFRTADKKGLPQAAQAGDTSGAEGVLEVLNTLEPTRMMDGWGAADAPDVLQKLTADDIPLNISMARALCLGWVARYADYPLQHLYDADVKLVLGAGMPSFYKSTLNDEYVAAVEHCGFSVEELEEIALNAIRYSFLPPEEKEAMLTEFEQAYAQLRTEHITSEEA